MTGRRDGGYDIIVTQAMDGHCKWTPPLLPTYVYCILDVTFDQIHLTENGKEHNTT